jgi:hypothetical protein
MTITEAVPRIILLLAPIRARQTPRRGSQVRRYIFWSVELNRKIIGFLRLEEIYKMESSIFSVIF